MRTFIGETQGQPSAELMARRKYHTHQGGGTRNSRRILQKSNLHGIKGSKRRSKLIDIFHPIPLSDQIGRDHIGAAGTKVLGLQFGQTWW